MTDTPERLMIGLRRLGAVAGTAALLGGVVAGCGSNDEDATPASTTSVASDVPVVSGPWARAATAGSNSAIYMSIAGGSSMDQLLSVSTEDDLVESVEIHETTADQPDDDSDHDDSDDEASDDDDSDHDDSDHDDDGMGGGMKTMRPVEMIEVPAGEDVELAPGGYHVMLMNLRTDLSVGDSIPITLTFKNAGEIDVTAEVREF